MNPCPPPLLSAKFKHFLKKKQCPHILNSTPSSLPPLSQHGSHSPDQTPHLHTRRYAYLHGPPSFPPTHPISRSDKMPMTRPSAPSTTRAPIRCSASVAIATSKAALGSIVTTPLPFLDRIVLTVTGRLRPPATIPTARNPGILPTKVAGSGSTGRHQRPYRTTDANWGSLTTSRPRPPAGLTTGKPF